MTLLERTAAARELGKNQGDARMSLMREQLRDALYKQIPAQRIADLAMRDRERARREVAAVLELALGSPQCRELAASMDHDQLVRVMTDQVLGYGPIEKLLDDDDVTEVMVNGYDAIFYEKDGRLHRCKAGFSSEEQLRGVIDRIVAPLGRRVDEQSPIVNARLPQGHRVNVVMPPLAVDGPAVTIRKFRAKAYDLAELVELGTLTEPMAQLLSWAVRLRCNIAVSGGTGGGKTTLLNALSREISPRERIVTIEDSAELRFTEHPHVVRLEARPANAEGTGLITIRDLVVNSLRMRPDRIIVGECRSVEAIDMLQAMNTGHEGSMTTLHANSVFEVVPRLVMMARFGIDLPVDVIEEQIASAIGLVVQQDRFADGSRRITQIAELKGRMGGSGAQANGRGFGSDGHATCADEQGAAVGYDVGAAGCDAALQWRGFASYERTAISHECGFTANELGSTPAEHVTVASGGATGVEERDAGVGLLDAGAKGSAVAMDMGAAGLRGGSIPVGATGAARIRPLVIWDRLGKTWRWRAEPCWLRRLVIDGVATEGEVRAWQNSL